MHYRAGFRASRLRDSDHQADLAQKRSFAQTGPLDFKQSPASPHRLSARQWRSPCSDSQPRSRFGMEDSDETHGNRGRTCGTGICLEGVQAREEQCDRVREAGTMIGVGAGQMSRVDSVQIAGPQGGRTSQGRRDGIRCVLSIPRQCRCGRSRGRHGAWCDRRYRKRMPNRSRLAMSTDLPCCSRGFGISAIDDKR